MNSVFYILHKIETKRKDHEETDPQDGGDAAQGQQKTKKPITCSYCKQVGHTKRGCCSRVSPRIHYLSSNKLDEA